MSPTAPAPPPRPHPDLAAVIADARDQTIHAAAERDHPRALAQADRLRRAADQLYDTIVRDMLDAGVDWWRLADLLDTHPQAVYDTYAHAAAFPEPPARQRPALAVVLTAGLCTVHDPIGEYGIDIDDLDPDHSLHTEPTVARIRGAAGLLGDDVWIAVTIPGDYEGAEGDPTPGVDAIRQWTSVVGHPGELTWLRESLTLNANDAAAHESDE